MKATTMVMSSYSNLSLPTNLCIDMVGSYIVIELRNMHMHDFHIVVVVLVILSWTITPSLTQPLYVRYGMFLVFITKLLVCLFYHDTLMGFHSTDHAPLMHAHWEGRN
jgi:hypothetical protein